MSRLILLVLVAYFCWLVWREQYWFRLMARHPVYIRRAEFIFQEIGVVSVVAGMVFSVTYLIHLI